MGVRVVGIKWVCPSLVNFHCPFDGETSYWGDLKVIGNLISVRDVNIPEHTRLKENEETGVVMVTRKRVRLISQSTSRNIVTIRCLCVPCKDGIMSIWSTSETDLTRRSIGVPIDIVKEFQKKEKVYYGRHTSNEICSINYDV